MEEPSNEVPPEHMHIENISLHLNTRCKAYITDVFMVLLCILFMHTKDIKLNFGMHKWIHHPSYPHPSKYNIMQWIITNENKLSQVNYHKWKYHKRKTDI